MGAPAMAAAPSMTSAAPVATGSSAEEAAKAAYLAKMADGPFYSKKTGPASAPSAPAMAAAPSMTSAAPMATGSSAEAAAKACTLRRWQMDLSTRSQQEQQQNLQKRPGLTLRHQRYLR